MEIKKNNFFDVDIIDVGTDGEGICKIDGFTIFVKDTILNEKVTIKILKVNKNFGFGKLIKIIESSPYRVEPPCEYYNLCGGCNIMHIDYNTQLKLKTNAVKNSLKKIAHITDITVEDTIGMGNPLNYRNKASFPVKSNNGINIGFYKARSHDIVDISKCIIQNDMNSEIISSIKQFISNTGITIYNEKNNSGILRHIITRTNKNGNCLLCLVVNCKNFTFTQDLLDNLSHINSIKSVVINYNTRNNNVIMGNKTETIFGDGYIMDSIDSINFKISATSFYQVNATQMKILYNKAIEYCELTGSENIIDIYCGIGTISLLLSKKCKKVYGIELNLQAIKDAKENAAINNIKNVEFIEGYAEDVIPKLINENTKKFNTVVLDPPRKGCDTLVLETIAKSSIEKIIYISCNHTTLARDIKYLNEYGYSLEKIQPVDMFCMSMHVETVCLLSKLKYR